MNIFQRVKKAIQKQGWGKYSLKTSDNKICLIGGLNKELTGEPTSNVTETLTKLEESAEAKKFVNVLHDVIEPPKKPTLIDQARGYMKKTPIGSKVSRIMGFNDTSKSEEDVYKALDKASEKLEKEKAK